MNNEKVIEGEKLIGTFMGDGHMTLLTAQYPDGYPHRSSKGHGGYEPLQYHSSWDWLMPACKKFCELLVNDDECAVRLFITYRTYRNMVAKNVTTYEIAKAFNALAEAITWYNQNKQQ